MYCTSCGKAKTKSGNFCIYCGTPFSPAVEESSAISGEESPTQPKTTSRHMKKIVIAVVLFLMVSIGGGGFLFLRSFLETTDNAYVETITIQDAENITTLPESIIEAQSDAIEPPVASEMGELQMVQTMYPAITSILATNDRSFAMKDDGSLWAWGAGADLTTVPGWAIDATTPFMIMDSGAMLPLAGESPGGLRRHYILRDDNSLWGWGNVPQYTEGEGWQRSMHSGSLLRIIDSVTAVYNFQNTNADPFVVREDGGLYTWGRGRETGAGVDRERNAFTRILDSVETVSISPLGWNAFAIQTDGNLWGWGKNHRDAGADQFGILGDGTMIDRYSPVWIMGSVAAVYYNKLSSDSTTFAIRYDGSLWGWGANWDGMLGSGRHRNAPVHIMDSRHCTQDREVFLLLILMVHCGDGVITLMVSLAMIMLLYVPRLDVLWIL